MYSRFYFLVFFLFSFLGFSQNDVLTLSVSNSNPKVGEAFEVSVKSSINGAIQVVLPVDFISGGAMSGMSQQITNSRRSTVYYKTEMGYFQREGEYVLGPAKIRSGNKIFTSNKIIIKVISKNGSTSQGPPTSKNLSDRIAFGLIETNKTTVYLGEPVRINARVYAQFEPNSFEDYKEYVSKGLPDKQKLPNPDITNVEMKNYQNKRFYSFSYDKSICFPTETGTFIIQPFEMTLGNFFDQEKIVSENAAIEVKALPENKPQSFNGAVGQIKMERIVKKGAKKQGDVAIVSFVFSGSGNIHSIEIPDLKLPPSIQLYGDPEIREDFQFTEKGAEGKLTIDYNLQMLDPGKLYIPTFEFCYFDLENENYVTSKADSISFDIVQTPGFDRKKAQEEANKRLTSKKDKQGDKNSSWSLKTLFILLGISLLLIVILVFIAFRKKRVNLDIESNPIKVNKELMSVDTNSITHQSITNLKIDLAVLESKIVKPNDYINSLSKELDIWLNEVVSVQLSRTEKLNLLENDPKWGKHISSIKLVIQKIDEARYGLSVDTFYCQRIQEKLEEVFRE